MTATPTIQAVGPAFGALFEAAFDHAFIGMAVLDGEGRWLRVNQSLSRTLGVPAHELLGRHAHEWTGGADGIRDAARFERLVSGTIPAYQVERHIRTGSGRNRWVRISNAVARGDDGPLVVMQVEDISRRHRRETRDAALLSELRRSNHDLEVFSTVAAHDLHEPLRKIRTFGDRLVARSTSWDPDGREYLERMLGAAARMQDLIDDLLTYARVARSEWTPEPVDLHRLTLGVADDLGSSAGSAGAQITVGSLPVVAGNEFLLRQLFQNLVANAIKFRYPGTEASISISAAPQSGSVLIHVVDAGIGFEPRYADRVFEAFERLHARTDYPGTGMGLAICRRIAERHGGTITAESAPGLGARFTVRLPHASAGMS